MFKTKLQEYCHSKAWVLPSYGVTREGPDHFPHFKAVVDVNGVSFTSPCNCNTSKEAQNHAAKLAFEYFTGCSNVVIPMTSSPVSSDAQLPEMKSNSMFKDGKQMYKNQLQNYAQKRNLELPIYSVQRVGPSHASLFKCKVTLEDKTYESEDYFYTIKEAESAAAKLALASIFPRGFEEDDPSIYKNLLQELFQKEVQCLPKYNSTLVGPPHNPVFISVVEIQGETFRGQAKTKKLAEMNAAKVAYITLKERKCKQDDGVNDLAVHLKETSQPSSASIPEVGSDAQPMFDKQVELNPEKVIAATPNSFTGMPGVRISSEGIQEPEATQTAPETISCSNNPSSSISSKSVNKLHGLDKEKKKKKIMVFPQSSPRSHPDASVVHQDEKWIAFATDSY